MADAINIDALLQESSQQIAQLSARCQVLAGQLGALKIIVHEQAEKIQSLEERATKEHTEKRIA